MLLIFGFVEGTLGCFTMFGVGGCGSLQMIDLNETETNFQTAFLMDTNNAVKDFDEDILYS
jgi:hypothetical protein